MFKKKIAAILAAMLMLAHGTAMAADVSVKLNGEDLPLNTNAYIKDNRTMVPLRGVFEAVGATVSWDGETRTAMIAQQTGDAVKFIFLQIGSTTAFVNSEEKTLEVPAEINNDYTMIPLRFVMDNLGANVTWDAQTYTVNIVTE